jgi:hypothetical protein
MKLRTNLLRLRLKVSTMIALPATDSPFHNL